MNTLPSKRKPAEPADAEATPTWRELAERFRDVDEKLAKLRSTTR